MAAVGIWTTTQAADSAFKVDVSMTFMDKLEATFEFEPQIIENLVMLKLKGNIVKSEDKVSLNYSFSLSKHDSAKGKIIKVNIANKRLDYSAIGIETPDVWSDWQPMGYTEPFVKNKPEIYFAVDTFLITLYEEKKDAILSKLYADTDFTDFCLSTSEGSVAVHKAYMAAHSEVFKAMLTKEWKETAEGQINVKGATVKTLQQLKDYMYLGTVPQEGLRPLLLIARLYLIEDLEKQCIRKLAESVSADELYSLVQFACDNNIPELACTMLGITQDFVIETAYALKKVSLAKEDKSDTDSHD